MSGSGDERLRAATSEQGGYRVDTDDVVADLELGEAEINPAEQRKRAQQTGPGGAMMPPLVGGAANPTTTGAAGAANAARATTTPGLAGGGAPLATSGADTGVGPLSGGGALGGGGTLGSTGGMPGSGAGVLGAAGGLGTMAAGAAGGDYGFGVNPATGEPWKPSDPGFTEHFGTWNPDTHTYTNPITKRSYDPTTGRWTTPGVGGVPGSTIPTGPGGASHPGGTGQPGGIGGYVPGVIPTPSPGNTPTPTPTPASGPGLDPAPGWTSTPTPSGGGTTIPSGSGNDFQVSVPDMHTTSKRWDDLSARMATIAQSLSGLDQDMRFEMVAHASDTYQSMQGSAQQQTTQVSSSYYESADALHRSATDYETTEAENTSTAESTGDHK